MCNVNGGGIYSYAKCIFWHLSLLCENIFMGTTLFLVLACALNIPGDISSEPNIFDPFQIKITPLDQTSCFVFSISPAFPSDARPATICPTPRDNNTIVKNAGHVRPASALVSHMPPPLRPLLPRVTRPSAVPHRRALCFI